MANQRAHFPHNPIVAHLLEAQRVNNERGAPAGRSYAGGGPVDAGIPSRVSSAAMTNEPEVEVQLSPEERSERDRLARDLGILPREESDSGQYADLDAALAAAAPVERPADVMTARRLSVEAMNHQPRMTATEAYGSGMFPPPSNPVPVRSKLIDFKRLQSVDLIDGVAIVDGIEIQIPDAELRQMKKRVLELAVDYVTRQLAEALHEVLQDGMDGEEGVQGLPAREAGGTVPPRQQTEGRPAEQMQGVRPEAGSGLESREETPAPDAGSATDGGATQ